MCTLVRLWVKVLVSQEWGQPEIAEQTPWWKKTNTEVGEGVKDMEFSGVLKK